MVTFVLILILLIELVMLPATLMALAEHVASWSAGAFLDAREKKDDAKVEAEAKRLRKELTKINADAEVGAGLAKAWREDRLELERRESEKH